MKKVSEEEIQKATAMIASAKRGSLKPSYDMPADCMYGYLGQLANSLLMPLGWSYLSLLAVAAGRYSLLMNTEPDGVRAQVYALLLGSANDGKSMVISRAWRTLNPDRIGIESRIPGSDIGLFKFFALPKDVKVADSEVEAKLLIQDEFEGILQKMQIAGSALEGVLRSLFYDDVSGTASKGGDYTLNIRLSILGALPVSDAAGFRKLFSVNTSGGLYDRFLIAPGPLESCDLSKQWAPRFDLRYPTHVSLSQERKVQFWDWAKIPERDLVRRKRRRIQELALRVAVISASMHGDTHLTDANVEAALNFAAWQERIREGGFAPSKATNTDGMIYEDLVDTFLQAADGAQAYLHFPQLSKDKHWSRSYGSGKMLAVRDAMVRLGELIPEVKDSRQPPTDRNLTHRYCLADHFFKAHKQNADASLVSVPKEPAAALNDGENEHPDSGDYDDLNEYKADLERWKANQ